MPTGLGWAATSTSRQQNGSFTVDGPHVLDAQLLPTADLTFFNNSSGSIWVAEETKPVTVRVSHITWRRASGRFEMPTGAPDQVHHVRTPEYNALAAAPVALAYKTKPSNDGYWRAVSEVGTMLEARAAPDGGAELSGEFTLGPTNGLALVAHFPERAVLVLSNGFLRVVNDRVIPADSFLNLSSIQPAVAVPMLADCQLPACGSTPGTNALMRPDNARLRFTTDGGLVGGGDMVTPFPLRWGWIPSAARYAHRTDPFNRGSIHIPGHFLPGSYSLLPTTPAVNRRPAVMLLSGANPDTGVVTERPRDLFGYHQGFADYAGMNFRAGPSNSIAPSGLQGESTLGGNPYGPYDLKGRSKYYVRRGGVSGIHDKVQTAPQLVIINGYQFTFLNFGLAFLLNENVDSRTEGSLYLPYPTDATINFEKLLFLCNGALDKADVQNGPQAIVARYWEAPLDVAAIEFTRDPAQLCNPGNGFLALGVDAYMAHVSDSFQGKLGVFPHGNFIPRNGGPTNSNQTLNYLQILLDGAGVPLRNTSGTALELHLRPWSHNGLAAANIPARVAGALLPDGRPNPGVRLTLHDVSGEPLDTGLANHWGYFGAGQTAAWLRDVGRGGRASVTVASTTPAFALDFTPPYNAATFFQGRELAGLVVLPAATPNTFTHPYGGGSDAAEAAAWRAAAIAYYTTNLPPTLGVTIDPLETVLTLVFEQWVTKRFIERGLLPASYLPTLGSINTNRLTLTAWRASEPAKPIPATGPVSGLVLPAPEQLAGLEEYRSAADPGHKLSDVVKTLRETLRDSADPKMAALRAVTLDVYRLSARWGGIFPGAFPSPLDALREFLATGVMPVAYRNDWTNGLPPEIGPTLTPLGPADYATALDGLSVLLALPAPRPVVVRDLVVRPDSVGLNCTLLNRAVLGTPVALVTAEGRPFRFPSAFALVPGVAVRVTAYADLPVSACASETLEVIRLGDDLLASVTGVPLPSPTDTDGNLLDDDWERLFLGGLGSDPFAGLGSGYTLLQAYLDGADPALPGSYGQRPPASLAPPAVDISRLNPTTLQLLWQFPAAYAPRVEFKLQGVTALGGLWENLPAAVEDLGGGHYRMLASAPVGNTAFWRLTLRLR